MKLATSVAIVLLAGGSCWGQSGFSGTVTNSSWGVTIWVESKLEPPTPDLPVNSRSGVMQIENARPGMRRYTANERTHEYFGYDMIVEPLDRVQGSFRVSFAALPTDGKALGLRDAGTWHRAQPPSFPRPETINLSDKIAVDLFEDLGTGQRVVDYIHFTRDNCDVDTAGPSQLRCLQGKRNDVKQFLKEELARAESSEDSAIASRTRDSQRAWESYLQATCGQLTSEIERLQCELRLTRSRIQDLASNAGVQQ